MGAIMEAAGLGPAEVYRVAGEAMCDPRTVRRFMSGERMSAMVRERIRSAMDRLGLPVPEGR